MKNKYDKIAKDLKISGKVKKKKIGRHQINKKNYKSILIHNIPFIFTCDEKEKLKVLEHHSVIINKGIITDVLPAKKVKTKNFDLIYDAGAKGGVVVTPGFINAHAHSNMYLLRSAMTFDEGENIDEALKALPAWEETISQNAFTLSIIGDITEQQKFGITTTLNHYNYFYPAEAASKATNHNFINGISVASHCSTENSPNLIRKLIEEKNTHSRLAMTVHYLYKANPKVLKEVRKIIEEYNILFTCHMSESQKVINETVKKYGIRETAVLEKFGLLNNNTIVSHAIHLNDKEIKKMAKSKVGIVHLPTSNTMHKSGTFPYWKYHDAGAFENIALGTDSVVSKSRLDILTEAYQTRLTHLFTRTVKFGSLFKMMTVNGARILKMDNRGRIIPGQIADMVFWKLKDRGFVPYDEKNPFTLLGNLITHSGRVARDVMINGKFVIKDRRHQLIDESKLLEKLQEKHMNMRKKVRKK